jgi:hypothetical protein
MSIGDKGPRLGSTQGKSREELSDQLEALRSQLQNLTTTVTDVAGKQFSRTQESSEQAFVKTPSRRWASPRRLAFSTR